MDLGAITRSIAPRQRLAGDTDRDIPHHGSRVIAPATYWAAVHTSRKVQQQWVITRVSSAEVTASLCLHLALDPYCHVVYSPDDVIGS
jgi:hypothetical protein